MSIPRIVYSVTDVNRYIKTVINQDENLKYIFVKGEISNFKSGANGHLYFSLKDKDCLISVCMFATYASKLAMLPKNGDEVTLLASVDVYPARGTYQLIAYELEQKGQGSILVELENLKKQLLLEGLFDESRKRRINIYPSKIGVITAPNGAAIHDIVTNIRRRYPLCEIYFFPSAVQGDSAAKELLAAFKKSQEYDLDTLIIGRGGGASEDLFAFNDEALVRAIATSKMPVIAAVGHEIDSTLVDFVADKRASTPTGAAELATVDVREIEQKFDYAIETMKNAIADKLEEMKQEYLDLKESLSENMGTKLLLLSKDVEKYKEKLSALNPNNVLSRGYSISMNAEGKVVKNVKDIKLGDKLITVLKDGKVVSKVEEKEGK